MITLPDKIKSDLKEYAINIGEKLIQSAYIDGNGIFWKTLSINANGAADSYPYVRKVNENIYGGSSGIILFITELYLHTGDEKYERAIFDSCNWLMTHVDTTVSDNYAFITGRTGVAWVINRVGRLFDRPLFIEWSLSLARQSISFIRDEPSIEYLNGISGTAWGLLLFYEQNPEEWMLSYLKEAVDRIVNGIHIYKEGFYWDRNENQIRGLCGISHGSAGVAALLCELGYFFNNDGFLSMAASALRYENYFFDWETGQWPDFRKNGYDEMGRQKSEESLRMKDAGFFERFRQMSAWCHGNIGIGLVHERLLQVQRETKMHGNFKPMKQGILKRSLEMHIIRGLELGNAAITSYNLCHGICGNMDLFLQILGKPGYSWKAGESYLKNVIVRMLYDRDKNKPLLSGYLNTEEEDECLFAGIAGMGYFALRCLDPGFTTSILYPALQKKNQTDEKLQCPDIASLIVGKKFPHTIAALKKHSPTGDFRQRSEAGSVDGKGVAVKAGDASRMLNRILRELPPGPAKRECRQWLSYEKSRNEWDLDSNNHYLFIEQFFYRKLAGRTIEGAVGYSFVLSPQVRLHTIHSADGDFFLVSCRRAGGIREKKIRPWMYLLLNVFKEPKSFERAMETLSLSFADFRENQESIITAIEHQFREALASGLLVAVSDAMEAGLHLQKQEAGIL